MDIGKVRPLHLRLTFLLFRSVHALRKKIFELMVPHGTCLARDPNPPLVVLEVAKVNFEHALGPLVQLVHSTLTFQAKFL